MALFKKGKVKAEDIYSYNKEELFRKERNQEPMTYQELELLQREKSKELSNQILRVVGLVAILALVILVIGTFLYPYSLFNVFPTSKGKLDTFWNLWSKLPCYVGTDLYDKGLDVNEAGFVELGRAYAHGFMPGTTFKYNFYVLGGWAIIPVCTIGLVALVIVSAYIVAYNVRDLVAVIKHFIHRTANIVSDVGTEAGASIRAGLESGEGTTKKEERTDEIKNLFDEEVTETPAQEEKKEKRRKEDTNVEGYSSEDLDRLLSGESIKEDKE